MAQVRESEAIE